MSRWLVALGVAVVVVAGLVVYLVGFPRPVGPTGDPGADQGGGPVAPRRAEAAPPPPPGAPLPPAAAGGAPLIVIADARFAPVFKQDVPSQRDGQLMFIGVELRPEEVGLTASDLVPQPGEGLKAARKRVEDRLVKQFARGDVLVEEIGYLAGEGGDRAAKPGAVAPSPRPLAKEELPLPGRVKLHRELRLFRRLKEGDRIREGDLVALVDPALTLDDLVIKTAKLDAADADHKAAVKTRDEAENRYNTAYNLWRKQSESFENVRGAQLTWDRYKMEAVSKEQAITLAAHELKQSQTTLEMHALRSKIDGVVKAIYKNRGDAVKNLEPVLQVQNVDRLRIEGLVEVQYRDLLKNGMEVVVEPTVHERHERLLRGHLQEVTGVAVSGDSKRIVSGSEDRTVRVWDRQTGKQVGLFPHPVAVKAVACTPAGSKANLCLSGAADGVGRLWDLEQNAASPLLELREGAHKGAMNCAAFSPDGAWCATGGDDKAICLWETATGKLLQRFAVGPRTSSSAPTFTGHRGAVTSVQFLSGRQLVSAGRDNVLAVWSLGADGSVKSVLHIDRRAGDVPVLGVNPKERVVLFDQGRDLRLLSVDGRQAQTVAVLQNAGGATNFNTMALFSPDGNLILTNSGSDGRLQLWRAPTEKTRAYELRQLVFPGTTPTSGAFAPDSTFAVTGTRERHVVVWSMPKADEVKNQLKARIVLIEKSLDSSSRQVRVWAELQNPGYLMPGATANMVIYPGE